MAADAPSGTVHLPAGQVPPPGLCGARLSQFVTACAAIALALLFQKYWPLLAGEPAARQVAFLKATLVVPMLLCIDRIGVGRWSPRHKARPPMAG